LGESNELQFPGGLDAKRDSRGLTRKVAISRGADAKRCGFLEQKRLHERKGEDMTKITLPKNLVKVVQVLTRSFSSFSSSSQLTSSSPCKQVLCLMESGQLTDYAPFALDGERAPIQTSSPDPLEPNRGLFVSLRESF
jgi:hypothetical protein